MKTSKTAITPTLTLALTTALGASGAAMAGANPFGMQVLGHGYQVAEAPMSDAPMSDQKTPDGKCGAKQMEEGKCGASKAQEGTCGAKPESKAKEGKCGEGKCGASKDKPAEGGPQ